MVASSQYVRALKSVALLGSLLMVIGYETELAKKSGQVRVNPALLQDEKDQIAQVTTDRSLGCVLSAGRSRCGQGKDPIADWVHRAHRVKAVLPAHLPTLPVLLLSPLSQLQTAGEAQQPCRCLLVQLTTSVRHRLLRCEYVGGPSLSLRLRWRPARAALRTPRVDGQSGRLAFHLQLRHRVCWWRAHAHHIAQS